MEKKNNSGALFKNDRKTEEKQPDYKGNAIIGGVPIWVSAWVRESQKGTKYMSMAFQPQAEQTQTPTPEFTKPQSTDDDLPF